MPLEHLMWPNIHWAHIWQVCSLELPVSLQQELMDAIWKKPEDMVGITLCSFVCCFSMLVYISLVEILEIIGWGFFCTSFFSKVQQWPEQVYVLSPSCINLKQLDLSINFQQSCWKHLNVISTHVKTYFDSTFLDPLSSTKHWTALMAPSQLSVLCAFLSALRHSPVLTIHHY